MGSPTEIALLELQKRLGKTTDDRENYERLSEVPFNNERKFMVVQYQGGVSGKDSSPAYFVKGSMEAVLGLCTRVFINSFDSARALTPQMRELVMEMAGAVSSGGLRVIFMAVGAHPDKDLALVGFVAMTDPVRRGVPEAVRRLLTGGVRVVMITGDSGLMFCLTYIREHCDIGCRVVGNIPAFIHTNNWIYPRQRE